MSESDPVSVRCESVILVSDFHNFSCSLIVNNESSSCDTCSACCKNLFRRLNLQKTVRDSVPISQIYVPIVRFGFE
ncbi:hypothetical protein HanXRQr2_Chr07g0310841 [Helianthus annuus]|uniref:Uncharacterized protein n=1 Tax=Helianthus annuus TaxID=4232 RepID=A0A251UDS9_HELAN|nr:hypothetical protein HanXRQr2_Chr07g0310841 [Helianthus annuus]